MKISIEQIQKFFLFFITAFILVSTPSSWIQFPDSGIYLGTAENMLKNQNYQFNGFPNLLYYPGISGLLLLPLSLFSDNYFFLQLYVVSISLFGIWVIRNYYTYKTYGGIGFFLPFLVLFSSVYSQHIYVLSSDCIFLTTTIFALFCWNKFESSNNKKYLYWCMFLVSASSLIRFQGVFICLALSMTVFLRAWQLSIVKNRRSFLLQALTITIIISLPFFLWTMRNYLLHTPDTFNMANARFFGMHGLNLYAIGLPGDTSTEGIDSFGQLPLYRSALYFGGLFEFLYGGITLTNKIILLPILITILLLGIKPWAKRANNLEIFYIVFSIVFFVKSILFQNNLHIILRYWIPLLPFIFLALGLGVQTMINHKWMKPVRQYIQGVTLCFMFILLAIAFPNITKQVELEDFRLKEAKSLASLKVFFEENIPQESIVATTDWGVMPRTINRRSFMVFNDPDHKQTIQRMLKYKTEFLVTYGKFSRMNKPTLAMVSSQPDSFTLIYTANKNNPNLSIFVYKVNLKKLSEALPIIPLLI